MSRRRSRQPEPDQSPPSPISRIRFSARWWVDVGLLLAGMPLFALALVLGLRSDLGATSWTVFHHGISLHTPLSIGVAGIVVGIIIIAVSWAMGEPPGVGTIVNMVMIGMWMDVFLIDGIIPEAGGLIDGVAMLVGSIVLLGFATAIYIKAGFGAGPRDALMLALTQRMALRIGVIRWGMEVTVVVIGILLGGSFGIGTIIAAALTGPIVDIFFNLLRVPTVRTSTPTEAISSSAD